MVDYTKNKKIKPVSILQALEKIISKEWTIAKNIKSQTFLGSFENLSKIFSLHNSGYIDTDIGTVDIDFLKFEPGINFQMTKLEPFWIPCNFRENFTLNPFKCIGELADNNQKIFEYLTKSGDFRIVCKNMLLADGLPAEAFQTKWREQEYKHIEKVLFLDKVELFHSFSEDGNHKVILYIPTDDEEKSKSVIVDEKSMRVFSDKMNKFFKNH